MGGRVPAWPNVLEQDTRWCEWQPIMLRVAGLNSAVGKIFFSITLQPSQRGPFLLGPAAPSVCGGVWKVELAALQRDCSYLSQTNCLLSSSQHSCWSCTPPWSEPLCVFPTYKDRVVHMLISFSAHTEQTTSSSGGSFCWFWQKVYLTRIADCMLVCSD